MKNFFKNMKSYKFWVNLSAAVIIFLNALSKPLGIEIENQIVEEIILGFAGVLVVLGLVSKPTQKDEDKQNKLKAQQEEIRQDVCDEDDNKPIE